MTEVNQEESEHDEVDGTKNGADLSSNDLLNSPSK